MAPIVVYDSGVGGLAIAKALKVRLPQEAIHYIGDTKNMPYGCKSTEVLCSYMERVVSFCLCRGYKLLVVACHTIAAATGHLLPAYFKVIGKEVAIVNIVDLVVDHVLTKHTHQQLGMIGTQYTVLSGIYAKRLQAAGIRLSSLATPLLASMVEASFHDGAIDDNVINDYLGQLQTIDALIPGCTHYIFLEERFKKYFKDNAKNEVCVIDTAELIALAVQQFLSMHDLINNTKQPLLDCFMATAWTCPFARATQQLFGHIPTIIDL